MLAGPFWTEKATDVGLEDETQLAETMMRFIEREGGRVALVGGTRGYGCYSKLEVLEIWRPASEMETVEATALRLRKQALSK